MLRNIKGIIFDFDGTLFDNALFPFYLIAACPPDMLRIRKERLARKGFAGCDYSSPGEYYQAFFATLGKACSCSPEQMRDWYFDRYLPRMVRVLKKYFKPRPGVTELFKRFTVNAPGKAENKAAGSPLPDMPRIAVYSDYPFLKERMEALGLFPAPEILLYGPDSFGAQKPAPRPFLAIATDLGASSEEILVIGDREETDGLGAFRAGMRFYLLKTGSKRYSRHKAGRPMEKEPHDPLLPMYSGAWDELLTILLALIP